MSFKGFHMTGPKQTRDRFRMSVSATWCHSPPILSLHKRSSSHRDWLRGECPKRLPLLHQESVSTLHTADLNPLQSVQRDSENQPKTKEESHS